MRPPPAWPTDVAGLTRLAAWVEEALPEIPSEVEAAESEFAEGVPLATGEQQTLLEAFDEPPTVRRRLLADALRRNPTPNMIEAIARIVEANALDGSKFVSSVSKTTLAKTKAASKPRATVRFTQSELTLLHSERRLIVQLLVDAYPAQVRPQRNMDEGKLINVMATKIATLLFCEPTSHFTYDERLDRHYSAVSAAIDDLRKADRYRHIRELRLDISTGVLRPAKEWSALLEERIG